MKIRASTLIIIVMYLTWISYLVGQVYVKLLTNSWFPAEVTYSTAALFIAETASLVKVRMAKEGFTIKPKTVNAFLSKIGVSSVEDFTDEAVKISEAVAKEATNERTTTDKSNQP